jgi:AraC family transcriptional regulator, transcriptional activator of pobA
VSVTEDIPYLRDLANFYKHIKARPPLHKDFDIREIDPKVLKNYDYVAKPFRHSFYCVTLFLGGDVTLNAGFWKARLQKPAVYFKTPCQVVSWQKPARWLQEYFIVFTEKFLADHKLLADIVFDLPFFQVEKAIPFELEPSEVELLVNIYKQILLEYQSDNKDRFSLIASYVHTLLLHVRRLYDKYAEGDALLVSHVHKHEHLLVERFRSLIRTKIANGETENSHLTIKYFASQLSVHPNHLNAVVKRQNQKTAMAFLHGQILNEAQSLLNQTKLTIKEIAFKLGFTDTSHFNNFFKKQTGGTPAAYRRSKA